MYGRFLPFRTLLTDGSSVCNEKREVVRLSSAAEWMWSPHHRLSAGVEGLGSRGRHFVWRLLNYKDGRHGWQSWVISLTTAPCLRSAATMWTLPLALSASVASNRTSTATMDKTNSCFLELLLLSSGSQYQGSVQKQLETANGVDFQEKRTLWRCLIPDLLVHRQLLRLPKHLWLLQLSLHCHHKPWRLCACCSTKSNTDFGSDASPLQFNVYYVKKYTHLGRTWLHS